MWGAVLLAATVTVPSGTSAFMYVQVNSQEGLQGSLLLISSLASSQ
jgi:hypothetical protein